MSNIRPKSVPLPALILAACIAGGSLLLAIPTGIFVFGSGWLTANLVSGMFVAPWAGMEPHAWPFDVTLGLLANAGFSYTAQNVFILLGLWFGLLVAALICGAILSLPQALLAKFFYGSRYHKRHWWVTIIANSLYALSFAFAAYQMFENSTNGNGAKDFIGMFLPSVIAFILLCFAQHRINTRAVQPVDVAPEAEPPPPPAAT